jgi:hypothetical protein
MRHKLIAIAATIAMTACNGAPPNEKILTGLCTDLFDGDAQLIKVLVSDINLTVPEFCGCYAKTILADSEKTALHKDAVGAIVEVRKAEGLGAEQAASKVEDMIKNGEIDTFNAEQLDSTGDDFQDIGEAFEDTGSFPAT